MASRLLIPGHGTNGGTTFTELIGGVTIARFGTSITTSTADSKYGGSSLYFGGVDGGYLTISPDTKLAFGSGDFTIEFWAKPTAGLTELGYLPVLITTFGSFDPPEWQLEYAADFAIGIHSYSADSHVEKALELAPLTGWHHAAFVRHGSVLTLYIDGIAAGTGPATEAFGTTGSVRIGADGTGAKGDPFKGYINDLHIADTALYTGDFSPPASYADGIPSAPEPSDMRAPSPLLNFSGTAITGHMTAELNSPLQKLQTTAHDSTGERSANLSPTSPKLMSFGGVNSSLVAPSAKLAVSGTSTALGSSACTAPSPALLASGIVSGVGASPSLGAPMGLLIGYGGAVIKVFAPSGKLSAHSTAGVIGGAYITAPLFELAAGGSAQNHGAAILAAPMGALVGGAVAYLIAPGFHLTAIGSATVSVAYEAYAVNLNHRDPASNNQVTRYTNYPFDRIVRYKNSYFGMNSTGLYLLEGTTDNATPIPYDVKTHVTDFDATEQKTVVSAYMGGRMGSAETVTLFAGEKTANAYPYTTPRGATPQNYRQKFGRGIKARYYGIGFKGDKEFDLDTLELEINKLPRRI